MGNHDRCPLKCSVTTDTALRLVRFYGNTPEFWLGLQSLYDLAIADWKAIEKEVRPLAKVV